MVVSPLVMNVFALWAADSFLQGDTAKLADLQARESLVRGSPSIVGQAERPSSSSSLDEAHSGEESEQIMGFQKWKRLQESRNQDDWRVGRNPTPSQLSGLELAWPGGMAA
uniref:Uncharacterized protein n=1 Tax=Alexandrium catenella TaxID=2925 RepID=A0A7S1RZY6_ALECA